MKENSQIGDINYQALYESSRDAIMMLAPPTWTFIAGNAATVTLFKAKNEKEFIRTSPWRVSPEYQPDGQRSSEKAKKMIEIAMKEGSHFFDWTHKALDGTEFPATVLLTRLEFEQGKPLLQATVRDISTQQNTMEALQRSRRRMEAILDTVQAGVILIECDSHIIVDVNPAAAKMIGARKEDIVGKVCHKFICQAEQGKCPITDLDQKVEHSERTLLTAEGHEIPVLKTATMITLDGKKYLLDSFVDLREQKQAEERIQKQNEFLRSVLTSLTHPFYVVDANDYTIKMANSAACEESLVGKTTCFKVTHHRDKPCEGADDPCPLMEVKQTKQPVVVEHIHYDQVGCPRNVEVHAYPIFDENGDISEIIEYSLDITDRKRAERENEEQRKILETVFNAAPVGMLLIDEGAVIKQVNHVTAKLVGKDVSEITDNVTGNGLNCIHSHDNKAGCGHGSSCPTCPIRKRIESVFKTGRPVQGAEIQATFIIGGQPTSVWLEVSAELVELSDKKHIVVALNNITERKESEDELKRTYEKLVEAAHHAGMGEVATDILHNVGNVLNSINISANSIRDTLMNSRTKNLKKVIDMISDHAGDLNTFLVDDERGRHIPIYLTEAGKVMVDEQAQIMGKLESLTRNLEHVKQIIQSQQKYARVGGVEVLTSINEIIEDAVQINREGLVRHNVNLQLELTEFPEIHIDKQHVLQILVNLISNGKYAVSKSEEKERLLIIRSSIHGENRLRIDVIDNGVGISEENMTKIFQHGFTTKKEGHGFGLHSSALAAREMGGSLTVYSDGFGHGTTFTLELPLNKSEALTDGCSNEREKQTYPDYR